MLWLDDIMHFAAHLFFELFDVFRIVVVPNSQGNTSIVTGRLAPFRYHVRLHRSGTAQGVWFWTGWIVFPQFLLGRNLIVVGEVSQEKERQHVIAEVVRVHCASQIVGDLPEGIAELFLVGVVHI